MNAFKSLTKQTHCLMQVHHYQDVCQHTTHTLLGFSYQLMFLCPSGWFMSKYNKLLQEKIYIIGRHFSNKISVKYFIPQSVNILWHRIFIFHPFHRRHWLAIRTRAFHTHWHLYLTRGICEMQNTILSSKSKGTIYQYIYIYIYRERERERERERTTHFKF